MDFECNVSAITANRQQGIYGMVDPTFQRAHRLLYEQALPIRTRYIDYDQNAKQLGNEPIIVRVLVQGSASLTNEVKLELRSNEDIFFNLDVSFDEQSYGEMKGKQGLTTDFAAFTTVFIKCMNKLLDPTSKMTAVLSMYADGKAQLSVCQGSEYKNIEVFRLELKEAAEEYVSQTVTHRYQTMKRKVELSEQRLRRVLGIIMEKNPSLLENVDKVPAKTVLGVSNTQKTESSPKRKPSPKKKLT